jgi:hypothetical protein
MQPPSLVSLAPDSFYSWSSPMQSYAEPSLAFTGFNAFIREAGGARFGLASPCIEGNLVHMRPITDRSYYTG